MDFTRNFGSVLQGSKISAAASIPTATNLVKFRNIAEVFPSQIELSRDAERFALYLVKSRNLLNVLNLKYLNHTFLLNSVAQNFVSICVAQMFSGYKRH